MDNYDDNENNTALIKIIELARWAPSGDNTQPWRFEFIDDNTIDIFAHDTRDWCVYDLDGSASEIAVGALLETIAIAATGEGLGVSFSYRQQDVVGKTIIRATFDQANITPSALIPFIEHRCTQRRPFTTTPLTNIQKEQLQTAVGNDYRVIWFEQKQQKKTIAKLLFKNAHIRLTIKEAYEVHSRIIEWDTQFSETKIPDQAIGLDGMPLKMMRWAMQSWSRVKWLNRYLAGTLMPRIQLDYIPGLKCAAHFVIIANESLESQCDFHQGGRALQRFWLTATQLGLQFQPEMTPLIFSRYDDMSLPFTKDYDATVKAHELSASLNELIGNETIGHRVFMGRVGFGSTPVSRSIRRPLHQLIK